MRWILLIFELIQLINLRFLDWLKFCYFLAFWLKFCLFGFRRFGSLDFQLLDSLALQIVFGSLAHWFIALWLFGTFFWFVALWLFGFCVFASFTIWLFDFLASQPLWFFVLALWVIDFLTLWFFGFLANWLFGALTFCFFYFQLIDSLTLWFFGSLALVFMVLWYFSSLFCFLLFLCLV